jgi:hypothetical protein
MHDEGVRHRPCGTVSAGAKRSMSCHKKAQTKNAPASIAWWSNWSTISSPNILRQQARANVSDTIGLVRGRPEKHEPHELPSLPPAKSLNNANGQLEDGIAKIAATLGGEHRSVAE